MKPGLTLEHCPSLVIAGEALKALEARGFNFAADGFLPIFDAGKLVGWTRPVNANTEWSYFVKRLHHYIEPVKPAA